VLPYSDYTQNKGDKCESACAKSALKTAGAANTQTDQLGCSLSHLFEAKYMTNNNKHVLTWRVAVKVVLKKLGENVKIVLEDIEIGYNADEVKFDTFENKKFPECTKMVK
jgi:hypothetical protein